MIGVIVDLLGVCIVSCLGALVGLLYPPKSPEWSRAQAIGWGLGGLAVCLFGLATFCFWFGISTTVTKFALVTGFLCLWGFGIVGNRCRRHHEAAKRHPTA